MIIFDVTNPVSSCVVHVSVIAVQLVSLVCAVITHPTMAAVFLKDVFVQILSSDKHKLRRLAIIRNADVRCKISCEVSSITN